METNDNLLDIVKTLYHWRKQIIATSLAAFAGSVIISLLLPVYYKGSTIFLAASPDQAKPELLFSKGLIEPEFYGNNSDIERLLTIAESNEVVDFLIDSFHLYQHYDIDSTHPKAPYRIREKFLDLYEVAKTKRDAIELTIEDRDRQLAAAIANAAREKIDQIAQRLIKASQTQVIQSYRQSIASKEQQLKTISDSLIVLRRRFGVFNSNAQSELLTSGLANAEAKLIRQSGRLNSLKNQSGVEPDTITNLNAIVRGLEQEVKTWENKINTFNEGVTGVEILSGEYFEASQALSEDRERLKVLEATIAATIPTTILVEKAVVPVIKSRPRRAIIVLAATAIALLFSIMAVLLLDTYRDVRWKEILKE